MLTGKSEGIQEKAKLGTVRILKNISAKFIKISHLRLFDIEKHRE